MLPQYTTVKKRATTTGTSSVAPKSDRAVDMSGIDVSTFSNVVVMKPSQMSRWSKQKQNSFIKRNKGCVDHNGWAKGRYMHPKFRKGQFLEVDNIQVFQLSNASSFSKFGGMLIHDKNMPKRFFACGKQVSSQRSFDREDTGSHDTNIGHETIRAVRQDLEGLKQDPPRPRSFNGFAIPNAFRQLTYENVDHGHNDDNFVFYGAEGSTVEDDIYNFAAFYEMVDGKSVRFIDDDIVEDYQDLITNYTNNSLTDSLNHGNPFRFWGDARAFRSKHPVEKNILFPPKNIADDYFASGQQVSFNADNMDEDTFSDTDTMVSNSDTVIEVKKTSVKTIETSSEVIEVKKTVVKTIVIGDPIDVWSDSVDNSTFSDSLVEVAIPVTISAEPDHPASDDELPPSIVSDGGTDLFVHNGSFAEYGSVLPVATELEAPPAKVRSRSANLQPSHKGGALEVSTSKKRKRETTVSLAEYEDLIDHFDAEKNDILKERAAVGLECRKLHAEVKRLTAQTKELTLSDKKWRDRAVEARYDLKYMVNSSAATVEILSAGMALQGFQTLELAVKNTAIKKGGQGLRNIKIVPAFPEAAPMCHGPMKCFSNKDNFSKNLCAICQFQITCSAGVLLLKDSYDPAKLNTKTTADQWIEGPNFGGEEFDHNRSDGHVVEVTQLPEVLKRKNLSVGSMIQCKRTFTEEISPVSEQSSHEVNDLGQDTSNLDNVSQVNMPDLDCLNDFQQSTTKLSQEICKRAVVDIEGPNFVVSSTPIKSQGFVFGIQRQQVGPDPPGIKLQKILSGLVESGMAHDEAAKFCQKVHPELIKEVEKAQESDEKFSQ